MEDAAKTIEIGAHVLATWKSGQKRFECIVVKKNENGTFQLLYSDGDYADVEADRIKGNPRPLPENWECSGKTKDGDECKSSNLAYMKKCSKCDASNPKFSRGHGGGGGGLAGFMSSNPGGFGGFGGMGNFFRKPKPAKVDINSLPSWSELYKKEIEPKKRDILVKRHRMIQGDFDIDAELNDKIMLWRGDITALEADAIVNAANERLWSGGGICGAIHNAAGDQLEVACKVIGFCETGQTVVTPGFELYAKHVLHSVGPTNGDASLLYSCYITTLDQAAGNGIRSVVMCCLSTGIFGFPNGPAAIVALTATRNWLCKSNNRNRIDKIMFCTFTQEDTDLYRQLTSIFFPLENEHVQKGLSAEEVKKEEAIAKLAEEESMNKFSIGDKVMACDSQNSWLPAVIEEINDQGLCHVHFLNYARRWDEKISISDGRLKHQSRRAPPFVLERLFS